MTDLTQIRARLNTSRKLGSIDSRDDDIATLLREVERLTKDVEALNYVLRQAGWGQGEIDNAASVCERLEADARRWRWVRENGPECLEVRPHDGHLYRYGIVEFLTLEHADEAVDQAIAAQEKRDGTTDKG